MFGWEAAENICKSATLRVPYVSSMSACHHVFKINNTQVNEAENKLMGKPEYSMHGNDSPHN